MGNTNITKFPSLGTKTPAEPSTNLFKNSTVQETVWVKVKSLLPSTYIRLLELERHFESGNLLFLFSFITEQSNVIWSQYWMRGLTFKLVHIEMCKSSEEEMASILRRSGWMSLYKEYLEYTRVFFCISIVYVFSSLKGNLLGHPFGDYFFTLKSV